MSAKPRIGSVTVALDPGERLAVQVAALRDQVDLAFIVDNGSHPAGGARIRELGSSAMGFVHVLPLANNAGVAGGLNHGIAAAAAAGCDFVLLLDHDSVPTPGMVEALAAAYRDGEAAGPVAAVGPRIRDSRDHHEFPFVRLGWIHNPRMRCGAGDAIIACDFLISSGTLVSIEAFRRVGELDASLFVDFVDLDWCCRARSMGFALYGACGARLDHELGEEPRNVLGGARILVHSPERMYYMIRNRLLLYRRAYVPLKWKMKDVPRGLLKVLTALLFVSPRRDYLRMTLAALHDAARGIGGARPRR